MAESKGILIAGNSPKLLSHGDVISSWKGIVVRFNDSPLYPEICNRTDELWTTIDYEYPETIRPQKAFFHSFVMNEMDKPEEYEPYVNLKKRFGSALCSTSKEVETPAIASLGFRFPSTGIIALMHYLQSDEPITLVGFSSSATRANGVTLKKTLHDWDREAALLQRLKEQGFISVLDT